MKKRFEPGYCEKCGEHKNKVIISGNLLASCNLDPLSFMDFVAEGDSISRLTIKVTESTKDLMEEKTISDLTGQVYKFCENLDLGDCPDCGMPIIVPWFEK